MKFKDLQDFYDNIKIGDLLFYQKIYHEILVKKQMTHINQQNYVLVTVFVIDTSYFITFNISEQMAKSYYEKLD